MKVNVNQVHDSAERKLSVIPIKVKDTAGQLVPTLAFLDNGSTSTFCTKELLRKLKVSNVTPTNLIYGTLEREGIKADSHIVAGLQVCDPEENNFLSLAQVFALDKLPVTGDEVITKEDVDKWPHLQDIDITTMNADVGLLIGVDVPQAMEPLDIMNSPEEGGPFSYKSRLGWLVHGYPRGMGPTSIKVNRIKVQEVNLNLMLMNMYNQEFQDVNSTDKGLSEEDKKWNDKVENNCRWSL